ncbi:hypothetical protein [Haloarchaeobius litoreus]|uniref:Uncharacterized protein n=1 Tax=Haloarchaeobius litoreus TaxID=755306 RepID=A0ABD6DIF6_9EURY|nr:hypothetical protein [Haloarchaeobius litoreus]
MRRRALLSTLATASIAGCNGLTDDGRTTRPPLDVETATPTATESPFREPSVAPTPTTGTEVGPDHRLVSLRAMGVPDGLALEAGFVGAATESHPALLWVGLRNVSEADRTVEFGATPPVSTYRLRGGDFPLYLVPAPRPEPTDGVRLWNACWKTRSQSVVEAEDTTRSVTIPPGATVGGRYGVVVMRGADVCLPTGQYEVVGDGGWTLGLSVFPWRGTAPQDSQFEDPSTPALAANDGVVRWFHESDADTTRYLEPSAEQVGLTNGRLRATLHNYGPGSLVHDETWALLHQHEDDWNIVAPLATAVEDDETVVRPGQRDPTTLGLGRLPRLDYGDPATVGGLVPGRYAVVYPRVAVWSGNRRTGTDVFAALVDLVGDAPDLAPSGMVESTDRVGDRLQVLATGDSGPSNAVVTVERTAALPDRSLVLSQVLQFEVLRDTLAYLDDDGDLRRVELRTPEVRRERFATGAANLVLPTVPGGGIVFAFRGSGYRVEMESG